MSRLGVRSEMTVLPLLHRTGERAVYYIGCKVAARLYDLLSFFRIGLIFARFYIVWFITGATVTIESKHCKTQRG